MWKTFQEYQHFWFFTICGILVLPILVAGVPLSQSSRKTSSLRTQLNPDFLRAVAAYKRLESKLPREDLRTITAIGILNGAAETEELMEKNLIEVIRKFLEIANSTTSNTANSHKSKLKMLPSINDIEEQLKRDQNALEILTSAMDLATRRKDESEFKREMIQVLQKFKQEGKIKQDSKAVLDKKDSTSILLEDNANGNIAPVEISQQIGQLRQHITEQVDRMKDMVEHKIKSTLDYLIETADEESLLAKANKKILRKRDAGNDHDEVVTPAEVRMINSILSEADFRKNLIDDNIANRKDDLESLDEDFSLSVDKETPESRKNTTTVRMQQSAKQENGDGSSSEPAGGDGDGGGGGGGGLVSIITSLSGGEGGSDIGALIGALTGLISTLFGPGGLDLESLISTGTSLISGLLAGNKNFGTVLGIYIGTAFDGLSGGGGAINNGQFLGNLLGTVVASLSADPEDDDEPPKPFLFIQTLFNTFLEAKNRKGSGEETDDRHDKKKEDAALGGGGGGGSDSGGFVKKIVEHLVSNAIGLILNASVGAVGGASHASHTLFSGSSSQHSKGGGGGGGHAVR